MEKGKNELPQAREGKKQPSQEGHDEKGTPKQSCGQTGCPKQRLKREILPERSRGKTNAYSPGQVCVPLACQRPLAGPCHSFWGFPAVLGLSGGKGRTFSHLSLQDVALGLEDSPQDSGSSAPASTSRLTWAGAWEAVAGWLSRV